MVAEQKEKLTLKPARSPHDPAKIGDLLYCDLSCYQPTSQIKCFSGPEGKEMGGRRGVLGGGIQEDKLKSGKEDLEKGLEGAVLREVCTQGRAVVQLWLLPPSQLAISVGVQLSLWMASSLGDALKHTAIWRILTSLPSQSSRSQARRPGLGVIQSEQLPTHSPKVIGLEGPHWRNGAAGHGL